MLIIFFELENFCQHVYFTIPLINDQINQIKINNYILKTLDLKINKP